MPAIAVDLGAGVRREQVLSEALPYIQAFEGKTFVVKCGGAAMESQEADLFARDVTLLKKIGIRIVLVHGGGVEITSVAKRLGIESTFLNGQRVTSPELRDVAQMVLAGKLNKDLVAQINRTGGRAVGISGVDGPTINVRRAAEGMGLVGADVECDPAAITHLIAGDFMPVVAPIGVDANGVIYNVNADVAASAIAAALGAEKLILMSDVAGVLVDGELAHSLTKQQAVHLIEDGKISGGMIPKVTNAFGTLDAGVHKVHVIDGRVDHALLLEVLTNDGVGTEFIRDIA
jgi:acetylglutamate kinase